jgi:hypothetical protein
MLDDVLQITSMERHLIFLAQLPVWEMEGYFKYYYLLQFAFRIQQPYVLQIEGPRKDYLEYMLHHINTLMLVSLSYACNFTAIGNAVIVYMNLPDVLLSVSKYFCMNNLLKKSDNWSINSSLLLFAIDGQDTSLSWIWFNL